MLSSDNAETSIKVYGLDETMRRQIDQLADWLMEADSKLPRDFRSRCGVHGHEHDELCTTVASLLCGLLAAPPDILNTIITIGVFLNLPPAEQHELIRPKIQPQALAAPATPPAESRL